MTVPPFHQFTSAAPAVVTIRYRSWDWCPYCAGRRAAERHAAALRRLADA